MTDAALENDFSSGVQVSMYKSTEKSLGKIIGLILSNPIISVSEMAGSLSISQRAVEKNISKLKIEQKIKRIGPAKGGHWEITSDKA